MFIRSLTRPYSRSPLTALAALVAAASIAVTPTAGQAQFASPNNSAPTGTVSGGAGSVGEITSEGLKVSIIMVAPNTAQSTVNVSARIENVSETVKHVAIIGPTPRGMDDVGNIYALTAVSGIGSCKSLENTSIPWCMRNRSSYLPADVFARLQPSGQAIATLVLKTEGQDLGQTLIYSMNLAVGGEEISDSSSRDLVNTPLAFPPIPIGG